MLFVNFESFVFRIWGKTADYRAPPAHAVLFVRIVDKRSIRRGRQPTGRLVCRAPGLGRLAADQFHHLWA